VKTRGIYTEGVMREWKTGEAILYNPAEVAITFVSK